jgi:hypothetical protein
MKGKFLIIALVISIAFATGAETEQTPKAIEKMWTEATEVQLARQKREIDAQEEKLTRAEQALQEMQQKIQELEVKNTEYQEPEPYQAQDTQPDLRTGILAQPLKTINFKLDTSEKSLKYMARSLRENYIPATTIIPIELIHGLIVPTGDHGRNNPVPATFKIVGPVILPNYNKNLSLAHCNIKGTASGNESTQQIEIRTESLHCVDSVTGEITKTELIGVVIGPDGFVGIGAEKYDNKNKKALQALLAGTLGGLSSQASNYSQVYTPLTTFASPSFSTSSANALGQGGSKALDLYAENIVKEMNALSAFLVLRRELKPQQLAISVLQGAFLGETEIIKKTIEKRNREIDDIVKQFEEEKND